MRHYGTLIAAVVISPLAWILLAFGQDRSTHIFANAHGNGSLTGGEFGWPLLMLAGAGLLLGLIGTLRFSPLGATFAGVVYMGSYALLLIMPKGLMDFAGHMLYISGHGADMSAPIRSGTSMALGAALLVSVFSVSRWRRWPRPEFGSSGSSSSSTALLPDYNPLGNLPERDTEPDLVGGGSVGTGGFGTSWGSSSLRGRQETSTW